LLRAGFYASVWMSVVMLRVYEEPEDASEIT
jgi:hypothetical protein